MGLLFCPLAVDLLPALSKIQPYDLIDFWRSTVANTFQCTLVTPENEVLDDTVTYASIPAWDGLMGLEPLRAPMLVKLGDGLLRLDYADGASKHFYIGGGFAQMQDNVLSLVANQAVSTDQIVKADIEQALAKATERQAISDDEVARKKRDIDRAKSMLHALEKISKN